MSAEGYEAVVNRGHNFSDIEVISIFKSLFKSAEALCKWKQES